MKRDLLVVLVVLLVASVGAGGTFLLGGEGSGNATGGGDGEASQAASTDAPDTPWGNETVVVGINYTTWENRSLSPHVEETLDYWNGPAGRHGAYEATFVLDPDADDPDVEVRVVPSIPTCGVEGTERTLGCAPVLREGTRASSPEVVEVVAGYNDTSTTRTLRHEFGHVLGIGHGERPYSLMTERYDATRLPQRDAADRPDPWRPEHLTVYVDDGNHSASAGDLREQVGGALGYYESGAEGAVETDLRFALTDDPAEANVVVAFPDEPTCRSGPGSCRTLYGDDPDGDGALEHYDRLRIEVVDVDGEAVGWHVGANLLPVFGADADRPPAFVDAGYEERRGRWWE
ncbi:hypothetical protein [Halomarina ordinaria]|uniref:Matrixin n=1 Tax=Halomarina ordinaria TaxID=3033939 RepID=A0ABD5UCF0_9EURY|nr:hypothetical protein [Halomarina sp. PSRA2]